MDAMLRLWGRRGRKARRLSATASTAARRPMLTRRLRCEPLEDRRLLTLFTVNSLFPGDPWNDGLISFHEALEAANTNAAVRDAPAGSATETDVIQFAPWLFPAGSSRAIDVGGTELAITDELEIRGPGAASLAINAGQLSRVFAVGSGVTAKLQGLAITGGKVQGSGGGILNQGSLTLDGATVSGNSTTGDFNSSQYGGGIYNDGGSLTVVHSTVSGNAVAGGSIGVGGGIYNDGGTVTITDSTLSDNSATAHDSAQGGAIFSDGGSVTIADSVFLGNSASGAWFSASGGAISNHNGALAITNSIFSGNSAAGTQYNGDGGAIYHFASSLTITNSTLSGNSATAASHSHGGGVYVASGAPVVRNSIIAGNDAPNDPDLAGGLAPGSGSNLIGGDARFVVPSGPGPDGLWRTADDVRGNLHLRADSTAINAGSNALALDPDGNPLATDLDGMPRVIYGIVDIGACEFHLAADANLDAAVTDLDASIVAARWQMASGATWGDGDFNGDGKVDDLDASILAANWQAQYVPPGAACGFAAAGVGAESDPRFIGPQALDPGGSPRRAALVRQTPPSMAASAPARGATCGSATEPANGATSPTAPTDGQVRPEPLAWVLGVEQSRPAHRAASRALHRRAVDFVLALDPLT